jgi:hypothetical protein
MSTKKSGTGEELKLVIKPELDDAALKEAQDKLDTLKAPKITTGGKGARGAGGGVSPEEKQRETEFRNELARIRLLKDQEDVALRKRRIDSREKIELLRQEAAAGKISMDQMNQQVLQHEQIIESTTASAIQNYDALDAELQQLKMTYDTLPGALQKIATAERGVMVARQRAVNQFDSMSGAMAGITSQTKQASLTFMNFGRIIQDAPFGLIGIANNIDPLLVSFRQLSQEVDDNTRKVRGSLGAFKALGAQLMGPAGLIFLLGSVLPSALLVLQNVQGKSNKESDKAVDGAKSYVSNLFEMKAKVDLAAQGILDKETILKEYNETLGKSLGFANDINEANDLFIKKTPEYIRAMFLRTQANILLDEAAKLQLEIQSGQAEQLTFTEKLILGDQRAAAQVLARTRMDEKRAEAQEVVNKKLEEANNLFKESFGLINDVGSAEEKNNKSKSKYVDESIVNQTLLNLLADEQLAISKDQNLSFGTRLNALEKSVGYQKQLLQLQINALIDEKSKTSNLGEQLKLESEILTKKQQLKNADKAILDFQILINEARRQEQERLREYISSDLENKLNKEKQTLQDILDSEFINNDQKLAARRKFYEIEQSIFDEYRKKAAAKDEKDRQEKLKKDIDARRKFVQEQGKLIELSQDKEDARLELILLNAQMSGNRRLEIEAETEQRLRELKKYYYSLGLLDTEEYKRAEADIHKNAEREKLQDSINTLHEVFNATIAIGNLAFGETKELRVAQVVIDTIFGVQRILAEGAFSAKAIAKSIVFAANGAIAVRKILQQEKGSSAIGASALPTTTTNEVFIERSGFRSRFDSPFANQLASQATPSSMIGEGSINIQANVDRRGLAIAVREGERSIRTQQFDYQ